MHDRRPLFRRGEHRGGVDLTNLNQPLGRVGCTQQPDRGRERAPRVDYLLPVPATIGWILLVISMVLLILGQIGRPVGGRRYWY